MLLSQNAWPHVKDRLQCILPITPLVPCQSKERRLGTRHWAVALATMAKRVRDFPFDWVGFLFPWIISLCLKFFIPEQRCFGKWWRYVHSQSSVFFARFFFVLVWRILILVTGRTIWSANLPESLPRLSEARRLYCEHKDWKTCQGPKNSAHALWYHGGVLKSVILVYKLLSVPSWK